MRYFFEGINSIAAPFNMVVWVVLIGVFGGIACTAICQMRLFFSHREELTLKREMLARGMSAEEIASVTKATGVTTDS